jgi:hypothetical protein
MSITTTNMGLTSWTSPSDLFNNTELADNWTAVDQHDHTAGKGVQIPAGGIATGAVTNAKLGANAVSSTKLGVNSVTTAAITDAAVTAAKLGALPAARVYNSINFSLALNNTTYSVPFNSERFDTDTIHSTGSNSERLTCKTDGIYYIWFGASFDANTTGFRQISIRLNGTIALVRQRQTAVNGDNTEMSISTIYALTATDYVEARVLQTSGGALDLVSLANTSPEFGMVRIA